jgi:ABC-type sugar transport system substrate-binding protein
VADHPVKVPPELFAKWLSEAMRQHGAKLGRVVEIVADRAAQWAADQQLEKINDWIRCLGDHSGTGIRWELDPIQLDRLSKELWQAMRPKPQTLAEQALEQHENVEGILRHHGYAPAGCIRAALTRLAELEAQQ